MQAAQQVVYLRTEPRPGSRYDQPARNRRRVVVECVSHGQGTVGYAVCDPGAPVRVEFYEDDIPTLIASVDDARSIAARQQAEAMLPGAIAEWDREHQRAKRGMSAEAWDLYVKRRRNLDPALFAGTLGYPTGFPPLKSARVVRESDQKTIELREWAALPEAQRASWTREPPATHENAAERMAHVVTTLSQLSASKGKS